MELQGHGQGLDVFYVITEKLCFNEYIFITSNIKKKFFLVYIIRNVYLSRRINKKILSKNTGQITVIGISPTVLAVASYSD